MREHYSAYELQQMRLERETFRYDLATWNGPRLILITDLAGKRSTVPLLGTVVLPSATQTRKA